MTYNDLWHKLTSVYDVGEAKAIVRMVLEARFGMSAADVYCGKVTQLSAEENASLIKIIERLADAEPVQYVLGEAFFAGRRYKVCPGVLIPRPETEELCRLITASAANGSKILDIGTGSGCIAITLALDVEGADVTAWDISDDALRTAKENAESLFAKVSFQKKDALNLHPCDNETWDVIVSNPPYICEKERKSMFRNVLEYEPEQALFVPDDNPLLFYNAIAEYAENALESGGMLFFEINPVYAEMLKNSLGMCGFEDITLVNDMFGKQRFIKATRR